jgi:putative ABC transport system permease protein
MPAGCRRVSEPETLLDTRLLVPRLRPGNEYLHYEDLARSLAKCLPATDNLVFRLTLVLKYRGYSMTWKLLSAEIGHRKLGFFLSLLAVALAATLFVGGPLVLSGYAENSGSKLEKMESDTQADIAQMEADAATDLKDLDKRTKKIMRDLGFNVRILHQNTDMSNYTLIAEAEPMPEAYVYKLAESPAVDKIVHLVPSLKKMVTWEEKPRLIVGFAPEITQSHVEKKKPMGFNIQPGTVILGSVVAEGRNVGDFIDLLGKQFEVIKILPPGGSVEGATPDQDVMIAMHLKDAQSVLGMPDQITEILALGCKCETLNRVEEVMAQLELVLPGTKVIEHRLNAIAREDQRNLVERHHAARISKQKEQGAALIAKEQEHRADVLATSNLVLTAVMLMLLVICSVWIGLLAWLNVRERREEIGLLRALGKTSFVIASLFLTRALIVGLFGGILGSFAGLALGWSLSESLFGSGVSKMPLDLILYAVIGGPIVAALASYLPALKAITQDPAIVLADH